MHSQLLFFMHMYFRLFYDAEVQFSLKHFTESFKTFLYCRLLESTVLSYNITILFPYRTKSRYCLYFHVVRTHEYIRWPQFMCCLTLWPCTNLHTVCCGSTKTLTGLFVTTLCFISECSSAAPSPGKEWDENIQIRALVEKIRKKQKGEVFFCFFW